MSSPGDTDVAGWHRYFEAQVGSSPDATAVAMAEGSLTYRELDGLANALAHRLVARGVGLERLVAITGDRSFHTVIGVLGVLKAGGAFVLLDSSYPAQRLDYMLRDCGASVVLQGNELDDVGQDVRPPEVDVRPANLAYVIYTSGSTGRPKGTLVTHAGLCNTARAHRLVHGLSTADRVLQFSSPSFDAFVSELVLALGSGASLWLAPRSALLPGEPLREVIRTHRITAVLLTPTVLAATDPTGLDELRLVGSVGEACSAELVRRWAPGRRFLNSYGPAEATIWASVAECTADGREPDLGAAIPGGTLHILDADLRPADEGELFVGGPGVARGYLGLPGLTAERFVPDPFSPNGARLYRTGDLARRDADGRITYRGRADFQVKIRGVRVELGEVEAALLRIPGVRQAAALVLGEPDPHLIGYVATDSLTPEGIHALLAAELPPAMLPSRLVCVPTLPLTPNGKVDRPALTTVAGNDSGPDYRAPRTPLEARLVDAWRDVLRDPRLGIDHDFFVHGGHSLLAARVSARLRSELGVEVPDTLLFEHRTVARLAPVVERLGSSPTRSEPPAPRPPGAGPAPLSFPQERVWFLDKLVHGNLAYSAQALIRLHGRLEIDTLERALSCLVERHEILRTTFPERDGIPVQVVHPPWPVTLPVVDLSGSPAELESHVATAIRRPFDIETLPLIRWTLYRLGPVEHALLQAEHHFVHDGWSFTVLLSEMLAGYRAGGRAALAPLPIQFGDFAAWQRTFADGPQAAGQLRWWRETLAGIPAALEIAPDRPRPAVPTFAGDALRIALPVPLCDGLRGVASQRSSTLYMVFVAALGALLHRWCGEDDVVLGTSLAYRRWKQTEGLIGMMLNTVALRIDVSGRPAAAELLDRVRQTTLAAYQHQDVPFERVVEAIRPERTLSRNPLFQVMCGFHDSPLPGLELPGLRVEPQEAVNNGSAKFDLNLTVIPRAEITVIWEYSTDLFDRSTIERLAAAYLRVLTAFVEHPDRPVAEIDLLGEPQRRRMLEEGNRTAMARDGRGVLDLVRDQVRARPDAMAVHSGHDRFTYRELWDRTATITDRLRAAGIEAEQRVGVCLDRSAELVAALLGVLAAGGAFVPIDPEHPRDRIAHLAADARLHAIVTTEALRDRLPVPDGVPVIDAGPGEAHGFEPIVSPPDQLAYVLYTSGSTGTPKGVAIPHRALANLLLAMRDRLDITDRDLLGAVTPVSFDIALLELLLPLTAGATVVVYPRAVSLDPSLLADRLARDGITVLQATPITWRLLVDSGWPGLPGLWALCGGEALPADLAAAIRARTAQLWNVYGPTETTIWSTASTVDGQVSIGGPLDNTRLYVLDRELRLVPEAVTGELYIGGDGLARGYLGRPGLTAERFLPDPVSGVPGDRMYRTGDLVRRRPGGRIEFVGRVDHQVKVRGFRIEPAEVEAALKRHAAVADAVVVARSDGAGVTTLAAYVVWRPGLQAQTAQLLASVREILPEYMVPTTVTALAALPRTPNGKLDRAALPAPRPRAGRRGLPRSAIERAVADLWCGVLGRDGVGLDENFFDAGGHSILLVRLHKRLREAFPASPSLVDLFAVPTVREMAAAVAGTGSAGAAGGLERRRDRARQRRALLTGGRSG